MDLDIFKADKKTIDVQKVVFRLWESRKNLDKVKELCDILCKFADERRVFRSIEFYLPQLAHLIIHMDLNPRNQPLEMLAMVISQHSMHAALQLNFLFNAAMEDYQPEMPNGMRNGACNPFYFARCARLIQDIERAIIFGDHQPAPSGPFNTPDRRDATRKINDDKRNLIERALKSENSDSMADEVLSGTLYYKRLERKSMFHSKPWKLLYFVVDQRVLMCYRDPYAVHPKRAIPLQNCRVVVCETSPKYGDTLIELINESNSARYLMRAESEEVRARWVRFLDTGITGTPQVLDPEEPDEVLPPTPPSPSPSCGMGKRVCPLIDESSMNPVQRKRFAYFKQMRIFVTNLTNICERLRFKEREVRKFFLQRDVKDMVIPPLVYVPMTSSADDYACILRALPKECHAFTTKARVPALILFEMEGHRNQLDVATFLGVEMEKYAESEVVVSKISLVHSHQSSIMDCGEEESDSGEGAPAHKPSKLGDFSHHHYDYWVPEGTGLTRLKDAGLNVEAALGGIIAKTVSHDDEKPKKSPKPLQSETLSTKVSHRPSQAPEMEAGPFGETFNQRAARVRAASPYGHLPDWSLGGLIAKSNDDVRQEVFVMQLISYFRKAFIEASLPVFLHAYSIMSTSKSTGLIELITDAISLDGLKKREEFPGSLRLWFEQTFGYNPLSTEQSSTFKAAMEAYIASMAGYSIVTYLLAIKDRHNGNIMIDIHGHVIHIDFGFVFGLAPGKQFSMEKAPWKLNAELAEVMGGPDGDYFQDYRNRCVQAFLVARKHARQVMTMMEIMQYQSRFPCFSYNKNAISDFRSRLFLDYPDSEATTLVERLMKRSYKSTGTDLYDSFQLATNGIAK